MLELNKEISAKNIARELGISYGTFRNDRKKYEKYLELFYEFNKEYKTRGQIFYVLAHEKGQLVPYKEYKKIEKNLSLAKAIVKVIEQDGRQTGANIARIIFIDNELRDIDWTLSTTTVYVRSNLRLLVQNNYYNKGNSRWCYLDKKQNKYILLTNEEYADLKNFFKFDIDTSADLYMAYEEGELTSEEYANQLTDLHRICFLEALDRFEAKYHVRPMKVPEYKRAAWATDENIKEFLKAHKKEIEETK